MLAVDFLEEYLKNENKLSDESRNLIRNAPFRESLYKEMDANFKKEYHSLLLKLLK